MASASECSGKILRRPRCGRDTASATGPCVAEKIIAANRANAARSTGPRTRAGKAVVARNALRHGLSVPVPADSALAAEAAELAQRIAGEGAREPRRAAALRVAEAQVDVLRIRRVRLQIMTEGFGEDDITARLMRLDRYERRALSRRKSAIKAFDSLDVPAAPRRRRNPWVAVAAAARLRGIVRPQCRTWQNLSEKPNHSKGRSYRSTVRHRATKRRRNPWAAVAAAARIRVFWQNTRWRRSISRQSVRIGCAGASRSPKPVRGRDCRPGFR